jgi:hypothetical protein
MDDDSNANHSSSSSSHSSSSSSSSSHSIRSSHSHSHSIDRSSYTNSKSYVDQPSTGDSEAYSDYTHHDFTPPIGHRAAAHNCEDCHFGVQQKVFVSQSAPNTGAGEGKPLYLSST